MLREVQYLYVLTPVYFIANDEVFCRQLVKHPADVAAVVWHDLGPKFLRSLLDSPGPIRPTPQPSEE